MEPRVAGARELSHEVLLLLALGLCRAESLRHAGAEPRWQKKPEGYKGQPPDTGPRSHPDAVIEMQNAEVEVLRLAQGSEGVKKTNLVRGEKASRPQKGQEAARETSRPPRTESLPPLTHATTVAGVGGISLCALTARSTAFTSFCIDPVGVPAPLAAADAPCTTRDSNRRLTQRRSDDAARRSRFLGFANCSPPTKLARSARPKSTQPDGGLCNRTLLPGLRPARPTAFIQKRPYTSLASILCLSSLSPRRERFHSTASNTYMATFSNMLARVWCTQQQRARGVARAPCVVLLQRRPAGPITTAGICQSTAAAHLSKQLSATLSNGFESSTAFPGPPAREWFGGSE